MGYRYIDENFFRSLVVRELSDQGVLAYAYLFTTGALSGIHYKTPIELAEGIGWSIQKWNKAVQELTSKDRVSIGYAGNMLWVKNHIDHQWLSMGRTLSPKLRTAIQKEILALPRCELINELINHYPTVFSGLPDTPIAIHRNFVDAELDKILPTPKPKSELWPEAVKLTHTFIARILQNNPEADVPAENNGNFESWVSTFEKILRLDKKEAREIEKRLHWCQANHFWKKNCRSPESFRKHYDRFTLEMRDEGAEWRKPKETEEERMTRAMKEGPK